MGIYKYEDGTITTFYGRKEDGSKPKITFPSVDEVIEYIDKAPSWDSVDAEVYEELCEELDLDYHSYDDPDKLFDDIKKAAAEKIEMKGRVESILYNYPNNYIRIDDGYTDMIKRGEEWLDRLSEEELSETATLEKSGADYYDYDLDFD